MSTVLQSWYDGCNARLINIAHQIEELGTLTRNIRSNAVKFDQRNTNLNEAARLGNSTIALDALAKSLDASKESLGWARFFEAASKRSDGNFPSAAMDQELKRIHHALLQSDGLKALSQYQQIDTKPRRQPTLLQKGARHFARLTGIFQLQDCFEQRVEHLATGKVLAKDENDAGQAVMLHVLNAQAAGLASMTSDFTTAATEAATALRVLHNQEHMKLLDRDSLSAEHAALLTEEIIQPLEDFIANAQSLLSDSEPSPIANDEKSEVEEDVTTNAQKNEVLEVLSSLETSLSETKSHHPRLFDNGADASTATIGNLYDEFEASAERLQSLANDLEEYASEYSDNDGVAIQPEAAIREVLENFSETFTMDVEREDHRSALSRLGLN